ncbi:MAG: ribosome small subunit-dependent GTPase A [Candidatus Pacebacteria bacterium]|nr:ribosome small subunit-dependent GTPase A [Candidatus Paceibacterota bacterium]
MDEKTIKIEDLGYNHFFEEKRKELGLDNSPIARVISEFKGAYKIKNTKGEFLAKITGKQIFEATEREDYPAVGDWVNITEVDKEQAVINSILPRFTIIKRISGDKNKLGKKNKTQIIATNIDVGFIIQSVDRDYNLNRFERYFSILENSEVKPVIILNKIDIISEEELNNKLIEIRNRFPHIETIFTSVINNSGLNELKNYIIKGKTYCFLGSSGVGKSSLINKLIGKDIIKTKDTSLYSDRGKHTTTGRQMYFLDSGGIVIDNPGIREVGITNVTEGIDNLFDEIISIGKKCKYTDCTHIHEPGCKIIEAVESGKIDKDKYYNFLNLKRENEYSNMSDLEKREKNKNFGKFINKAKKGLRDVGYDNY